MDQVYIVLVSHQAVFQYHQIEPLSRANVLFHEFHRYPLAILHINQQKKCIFKDSIPEKVVQLNFNTNLDDLRHNYTIWLDRYSCLVYRIHISVSLVNHQPNSPYVDCSVKSTMSMDGMFAHRTVN